MASLHHGVATVLNESTWELFLRKTAQALSETSGLHDVSLVMKPTATPNTFYLAPHPSAKQGLKYRYDLTEAHVNDLKITLFRSTPNSPVLDTLEGATPHYNGPTPAYTVHGLEQAVAKVIEIAYKTFVERAFPMDSRHRDPGWDVLDDTPYFSHTYGNAEPYQEAGWYAD
jgi:hypothetical protein